MFQRSDLSHCAAHVRVAHPQVVAANVGRGGEDAQASTCAVGEVLGVPHGFREQVLRVDQHDVDARNGAPGKVGENRIGEARRDGESVTKLLGRPCNDVGRGGGLEVGVELAQFVGAELRVRDHVAHSDSPAAATNGPVSS